MLLERYSRQEKVVDQNRLNNNFITIIGLGAIGRELTIKLAQMGAGKLILVDFDKVEEPNICTQGYFEENIGEFKVEATANFCKKINKDIKIIALPRRFSKAMIPSPVTFCCVDTMKARKLIWETVKEKTELFIDTRMSTEVSRILSVQDKESYDHYETTLFRDEEAFQTGCTTKATCYCASIAAGQAVSVLAKWSRGAINLIEKDISFDILVSDLMIG